MKTSEFDIGRKIEELSIKLAAAIEWQIKNNGGTGKCNEGMFSLHFPPYYDRPDSCRYVIELYCYNFGDTRHHMWFGPSWEDAFAKCEAEVNKWIESCK